MEFEWDEAKRLSNVTKHGIDFRDARVIFDDRPKMTNKSFRSGEVRFVTTAIVDDLFYTVIWIIRRKRSASYP